MGHGGFVGKTKGADRGVFFNGFQFTWIKDMASTRLLVVKEHFSDPQPSNRYWDAVHLQTGRDIANLVDSAFSKAYKQIQTHRDWQTVPSVKEDGLILFSYAPPGRTSHVSPISITSRLGHTMRKNVLYITPEGSVFRPAIEFPVDSREFIDLNNVIRTGNVLTERSYGLLWNSILFLGKIVVVAIRRFYGDRVIALHSAEDRSFFGSLYMRGNRAFISVLAHDKKGVLHGARTLSTVLAQGQSR